MAGEAPATGMVKKPFAGRLPRLRAVLRRLGLEERGTSVVEFALIAPVLFLIIFGIFDFGRALNYYNQETQLVGLAARAAAVNRCPNGGALGTACTSIQQQTAETYANGELNKKVSICIPSKPAIGGPVTVTSSYQFRFLPLVGAALGLGGSGTISIQASQTERQEVTPSYGTGCAT